MEVEPLEQVIQNEKTMYNHKESILSNFTVDLLLIQYE